MLRQGLRLSGEEADYFIAGRVAELCQRLAPRSKPSRILDFGCGIGMATAYIAKVFPEAQVVGVDTSENALVRASREFGSSQISFQSIEALDRSEGFDLCYVNGVFHHIEPGNRAAAIRKIYAAMRPGGILALFENNPWNPGTRMVMSRIPFDRDAITLSIPEASRLVREGGFRTLGSPRSLFYFPRILSVLRFCEPWLSRFPFGAQYYVLAVK